MLAMAREGAALSLAGGVTTVADCCYAATVAQAALETGLRAIVYLEGFSDWPDLGERLARELDALPVDELVTAGLSPHAPFTVTLDDYALLIGIARERGLPVATHMLESARESQHLDEFAHLLGPDTVLIHGVFMNAADIALAARLDVPVIHCPRSNALLGCGTAPVPELLAAGVRVGLGTDSPASAMTFDMWEEMRVAVMMARARAGRADALTAPQVLRMATLGGAEALGLSAETGSLEAGKSADLTVLDLNGSPFLPWDDPVTAAVFGGSPDRIVLSSTRGKIRYRRDAKLPINREAGAVRAKMIEA